MAMTKQEHFYVTDKEKEIIKNKANERKITKSDFCREKIFEGIELDKFSKAMDPIIDKFIDRISERIIKELMRQIKKQSK